MPAAGQEQATLTVAGPSLRGWHAVASSADLANVQNSSGTFNGGDAPAATRWQPSGANGGSAGDSAALSFGTGYGRGIAIGPGGGQSPQPLDGLLALTAPAAVSVIPGIATQAFLDSSSAKVGSTVTATIEGIAVPVRIVAAVSTFPTIAAGGAAPRAPPSQRPPR